MTLHQNNRACALEICLVTKQLHISTAMRDF